MLKHMIAYVSDYRVFCLLFGAKTDNICDSMTRSQKLAAEIDGRASDPMS